MNLHKLIFTENDCYKAGKTITPKGIMVHSTGSNNPWLKRYVGPDDGLLGKNEYENHWNQPMSRKVCVHAFIGKMADGSIATYQTLPWNYRGWHAGGAANNTHIGFEICEDGLTDSTYFKKVYQEAVELCAYLCKMYGLTEKDIICHCEGAGRRIASAHADVMHWFPKHGKSMDTFRADVKALLNKDDDKVEESESSNETNKTTVSTIGKGSKVAINPSANYYYPGSKLIPNYVKDDYYHVVTQTTANGNKVVKGGKVCVLLGKKVKKSGGSTQTGINTWVAVDNLKVVDSTYSNSVSVSSTYSGSTYSVEKLYPDAKAEYAKSGPDKAKAGSYKVNADGGLYLRAGASTSKKAIELMHNGSKVKCYGYYTNEWLYVVSASGKKGFCHSSYLKKC